MVNANQYLAPIDIDLGLSSLDRNRDGLLPLVQRGQAGQ
jgi:hypothetical protein